MVLSKSYSWKNISVSGGIFYPPFYYAHLNDVRDRLHEIEGLKIKDYWQHKDMRLEDCGFDVEIGGRQVSLTFSDNQDWVGLFDEFDGIYMSKPDQQVVISREQMNAAGLQIKGLEDLLQNLEVFKFCSTKKCKYVPKCNGLLRIRLFKYEDFLGYAFR